ncbi:MAG: hypothetical protein QOI10_3176 [Solirubrobacterales bacterium]|jgi:hypothetical protein|nr:hypothetical protein [Solirubrobacterales bacterium]
MNVLSGLRPSPALVIALVALVVAAAGVAVAQPGSGAKAKPVSAKKVKRIARKVSDSEIVAKAPTLTVASAAKADSATKADSAIRADSAAAADSANPIAFAHVSALGGIDPARSKNMGPAIVTNPSAGLYCFRGLPFEFKGAQVTTDFDDSSNEFGPQFGSTIGATCTPTAQAYVSMVTNNGAASINGGFFIVFYD